MDTNKIRENVKIGLGELQMLRMAIGAGDPSKELMLRVIDIVRRARSILAELDKAQQPAEPVAWIPVANRLPELNDIGNGWARSVDVLGLCSDPLYCAVGYCRRDPQGRIQWIGIKATHWMPLPYAPGEAHPPQAQQPGKVLTDDEVTRIIERIGPVGTTVLIPGRNEGEAIRGHMGRAIRYARDNGYLAPAAGLTVEEAVVIIRETLHERAFGDQVIEWVLDEDTLDVRRIDDEIRTRLTAAINAKKNKS